MIDFDLHADLDRIHSSFPPAKHLPIIGITTNYADGDASIRERYYQQVSEAGGTPLLIPPIENINVMINTLENIDALILSGGADHNPLWMGKEPEKGLGHINATRDLAELRLAVLAYHRQIPMLGICRGMQTLAIALGGEVTQDIHTQIKHDQDADKNEPTHSISIAKNSTLYHIYPTEKLFVNSFHHQAVNNTGDRFIATATAPDGIIEAMESTEYKSILGVLLHA